MLDDLGIVGISWRQIGSEALSRFTLPRDQEGKQLKDFAARARLAELSYLATCNRVEVIFARTQHTPIADLRPMVFELLSGHAPHAGEAERTLRAWKGEGAAEHLFLVAAGLDSACVGETEIAGQVRHGHELSLELGVSGPRLELLFEESLKIAGLVRGETQLGEGRVSLAELAVDHIRARLKRTPGRVALVGVSPMTERAARSLAKADVSLIIVNRSVDKARAFANPFGAQAMALAEFQTEPPRVEAVLSCTGAPQPVIKESTLERLAARTASGQAPTLIDMAVPPDIEPRACVKLALHRIGLDEITGHAEANRAARLTEVAQARELVDDALSRLHDRFAERLYGPLFGALQQRYQRTAQQGVKRLLKKELKGLGPQEREAIENWAEVLARRFAHIPTLGLRGLLYEGPEGSLEAFLQGLDPEFADELRAALAQGLSQRGTGT